CTETCRASRCDQSSGSSADHDQVVTRRGRWILPIGWMDVADKAFIVGIRRREQEILKISVHNRGASGVGPLVSILLARAFRARRVTNTVTARVASRPTQYSTHSPIVRCRGPVPT